MNREDMEIILNPSKQINLQKGQVTINPFAWRKKRSGKLEQLGAVMKRVQQKIAKDYIPRFMCPHCVSVEILGPFAWQEEEEANRKLPHLLGGAFQNRFVKCASHIHLATEKRKQFIHQFLWWKLLQDLFHAHVPSTLLIQTL